jgi:hypothetical protein
LSLLLGVLVLGSSENSERVHDGCRHDLQRAARSQKRRTTEERVRGEGEIRGREE